MEVVMAAVVISLAGAIVMGLKTITRLVLNLIVKIRIRKYTLIDILIKLY